MELKPIERTDRSRARLDAALGIYRTMPLSDSSATFMRALRPKPSPAVLPLVGSRHLRGLPVLVHGVSRRAWGLRLRRAAQQLALALLGV